ASHLGLPLAALRSRFVREVEGRRSLVERPNGDCVFLQEERGCAIHPVKPRQCVTFPFWPRVAATPESWRERSRDCPGMGQGGLWTADEIQALQDRSTPRERILEIARRPRD
ncbi:MAG: YkgJ family cysteine cluster protein, partial [Planctomycetota bacterium]